MSPENANSSGAAWRTAGLAILLSCVRLGAQTQEEWSLRPGDPAAAVAPPEETTFQPRGLDDRGFNRVVRKVTEPTLTVYHPAQAAHRSAALLVIAGGGYDGIVIDREGHAFARYFQEQGLTVIVLKYRLPQSGTFAGGLPAPQQDALDALRFIRRHADDWRINPNRVGVLGASAGGHIAGCSAIFGHKTDGSRPDFVALLYPVVTLAAPTAHAGSRLRLLGPEPAPARINEYSLEQRAQPGLPPFFLVHAQDDQTVPIENSRLLAAALQQASVPCEILVVTTGGHGFALGRTGESGGWKDHFLAWLDALP